MSRLKAEGRGRVIVESNVISGNRVVRNGRELVNFGSNDYLGLSQHPLIKEASTLATEMLGVGAGASRLVCGSHPAYAVLEAKLATMKEKQAAMVFGSGYLANVGLMSAIAGRNDIIIADKLSHACIVDGARLSNAEFLRFNHNDVVQLEHILQTRRKNHKHAIVITESIFSMDGDVAPLDEIADLCAAYDAWLVVDDAHGFGVHPDNICYAADIVVGTLSKAAGSYGGYVCASAAVVELLRNTARTMMFSTALPPMVVASSLKALEIIERNPEWNLRPLNHARHFTNRLGMNAAESQIVPIIIGSAEDALSASAELEDAGFYVPAIRPPTVPEGTARLRVSFTALHEQPEVDQLAFLIHGIISRKPVK